MSSAWAGAHPSLSARPAAARRASRQAPDKSCGHAIRRTRCDAHVPDSSGQESGSGSGGGTSRESSGSSSGGETTAELVLTYKPETTVLVAQLGTDGLEVVEQPVLASPALVACALAEYDALVKDLCQSFYQLGTIVGMYGLESLVGRGFLATVVRRMGLAPSEDPTSDLEEAMERLNRVIAGRQAFLEALVLVAAWAQQGPPAGRWMVPPGAWCSGYLVDAGVALVLQAKQEDLPPHDIANQLSGVLVFCDRPGAVVAQTVFLGSAAAAAGLSLGAWAGVDTEALVAQLQAVPSTSSCLAWTAPYLGATLAAHALYPGLMCKSVLRPLVFDQRRFFGGVSLPSCLLAAAAVAAGQCLVYQGMWQQGLLDLLGGSSDPSLLTDPFAVEDSLPRAMGTLVGAPRLPAALLAAPAALATGLLEATAFVAATAMRRASLYICLPFDDTHWGGVLQRWRPRPYDEECMPSDGEVGWTAARVAVSGTYLALEASLTGSLGLAVCTSAAGLAASMLLSKWAAAGSAEDDDEGA